MARGKYGARAANRLAQTDNELLVATAAERDELKLKGRGAPPRAPGDRAADDAV